MDFLTLKNALEIIQFLVIVFWVGYTYRKIIENHTRISDLYSRGERTSDYMLESSRLMDEKIKVAIKEHSEDGVRVSDLKILETTIGNVMENQKTLELRFNELSGKLDTLIFNLKGIRNDHL